MSNAIRGTNELGFLRLMGIIVEVMYSFKLLKATMLLYDDDNN